jgi:hypothetical protein
MTMIRNLLAMAMMFCVGTGMICMGVIAAQMALPYELWMVLRHVPALGLGYVGQILVLLVTALGLQTLRVITHANDNPALQYYH